MSRENDPKHKSNTASNSEKPNFLFESEYQQDFSLKYSPYGTTHLWSTFLKSAVALNTKDTRTRVHIACILLEI